MEDKKFSLDTARMVIIMLFMLSMVAMINASKRCDCYCELQPPETQNLEPSTSEEIIN